MIEKVFPDDFPDGFYLHKDGKLYAVDIQIGSQIRKAVDLSTGQVIYPSNAAKIREMSDEELAEWIADILNHCDNKTPEEECLESCPLYACCNLPFDNIENWLKSPAGADE